jgi:hypothetical protein
MEMIEMVEVPFEGYSKRIREISIGGKTVLVKPKVADSEAYMLMGKDMTEKDTQRVTDIFVRMIKRAYDMQKISYDEEDIRDFVAENYGEFFYESAVLFGFMSREEIQNIKKKTIEEKIVR